LENVAHAFEGTSVLQLVAETYVAAVKRLQKGCCSPSEDLVPANVSTRHNLILRSADLILQRYCKIIIFLEL